MHPITGLSVNFNACVVAELALKSRREIADYIGGGKDDRARIRVSKKTVCLRVCHKNWCLLFKMTAVTIRTAIPVLNVKFLGCVIFKHYHCNLRDKTVTKSIWSDFVFSFCLRLCCNE